MLKKLHFLTLIFLFLSCGQKNSSNTTQNEGAAKEKDQKTSFDFDLQGHRGARGLAPENTIPAFKKALELGVNTLELDIVVSKDQQLVVSHEPWFNHKICLDSLANVIDEKDSINIYQHTYEEIQKYDCGSIGNERFPEQIKQKVHKPLLKEVVALAEDYAKQHQLVINYNIEIKSLPEGDGTFHPAPDQFSELLIDLLKKSLPLERVTIQSFDFRVLSYLHENHPDYTLAALIYKDDVNTNLERLGFIPDIYSSSYELLDKDIVERLHRDNMKVIPWTVNKPENMKRLLEMGVDGLITDYPDRASNLKNKDY